MSPDFPTVVYFKNTLSIAVLVPFFILDTNEEQPNMEQLFYISTEPLNFSFISTKQPYYAYTMVRSLLSVAKSLSISQPDTSATASKRGSRSDGVN